MAIKVKAAIDRGESGKDVKLPPLAWKNTYRMARAMHFGDATDAEVNHALHTIETTEGSGEYGSMAAKMREQLDYYRRMPSNNKEFEPSLLRASFQNPYVEYYNFGTFAVIVAVDIEVFRSRILMTIIDLPPPLFFLRSR